jgi:probable HAF family extracellular repeat protein
MKKWSLLATIILVAGLTLGGCGSGGGDSDSPGTTPPGTTPPVTPPGTTPPTTTPPGVLGALTDIGDLLGTTGDAWYDTTTQDINDSGRILGSSMDVLIVWNPDLPNVMTVVKQGHGGKSYDDYYSQANTPSTKFFETTLGVEINNGNFVIGNSFTKDGGQNESRGYRYDYVKDTTIDLTPPNYIDNTSGKRVIGSYSKVVDINNAGEMVLTAEYEDGLWAYYWNGSSTPNNTPLFYGTGSGTVDITDLVNAANVSLGITVNVPNLRALPGTQGATDAEAVALNDNHQVIVNSGGTAVYTDLNNGGGGILNYLGSQTSTKAVDINNQNDSDGNILTGHVIGNSGDEGFFWDGGVMYPISNPSGDAVEVVDLNNNDKVVGNSGGQAFLWYLDANGKGVFQPLGSLGGGSSTAVAINDQDMVVGYSTTGAVYSEGNFSLAVEHGFLWANGAIYDLGAHSPPNYSYPFNPNLYFSKVSAISENGKVTGSSYSINAHHRGYTLTLPTTLP